MNNRTDDPLPGRRRRQPSLQELASRRHAANGAGRLGRFRSWQTIVVGLLALVLLAAWFASTR